MKGDFRAAQRAWDNLTPEDFEDEEREYDPTCFEMDEPEDPRIADYEWDRLGGQ